MSNKAEPRLTLSITPTQNVSGWGRRRITVTPVADVLRPVITAFNIRATAASLTVPVTTFTASDNTAVKGYLITETATAPLPADAGWTTTPPTSYTFTDEGFKRLYAWAKDAAGNVSLGVSDTVTIALPSEENYTIDYPGTVYYVNATHPSASDDGPGTSPDAPWITITKVNAATFAPGDAVLFQSECVWRGSSITVRNSGTAGNPITYGAYGPTSSKPVFNGAEVITDWTLTGTPNVWVTSHASGSTEAYRTVVVIDDDLFMPVATLAEVNADLKYFVQDSAGKVSDRIYVYSATNPATRTAELSTKIFGISDGLSGSQHQYITIKYLELRYYGYAGIDLRNTQLNGNFLIDNCTFYHNRDFAVHFYNGHENNTAQNNTVSYCGNGVYANVASNNSFIGNNITHTLFYNTIAGRTTDGHAIGAYNCQNTLIENNYIAYGNSALIGVDNASVTVSYNEVHAGTMINGGTAGISTAMTVNTLKPGTTSNVYYNLIIAETADSYCFAVGVLTSCNLNLYNNTFSQKGVFDRLARLTVADSITMKNNIFHTNGISVWRMIEILTSGTPVSNYNLWYDNSISYYVYEGWVGGVQYATLAAWTAATAQDANSVDGNPLFSGANDYTLQAGSPAINAGVDVGLTRDILGNPIVGLPDIGAYENQ